MLDFVYLMSIKKNIVFLYNKFVFQHCNNYFSIIDFLWSPMSLILYIFCEKVLHQIAKGAQATKKSKNPCFKINSEGLGTQSHKWHCEGGSGSREGPLHFLLMPGSDSWPEYINQRCNFFFFFWFQFVASPPPPPAASLDLCLALCRWCEPWGPCLRMTVILACPWSYFNLLLGHGQGAELSL